MGILHFGLNLKATFPQPTMIRKSTSKRRRTITSVGWEYRRSKQAESVAKREEKNGKKNSKSRSISRSMHKHKVRTVCAEGVVWLKYEPLHLFSSSSCLYFSPNAPLGHLANTRSNNSSTLFQIFCRTKKIVKRFSRFVKLFAQLFCTILVKQKERVQ